ncbi:DUF4398 domain-containing protein [Ostreibacterium oceani]|uniref:DUF4398 domain-containing protein n=1 Tax=Ostreibacterium oceani TaxID=2654998 RepID=A0A6N7EV13_9GAMM|nr:DUF4398 domain-containing protein [Ostreibacterium oceani]MPV85813.1 DUF4398 domain-containing protein [Ostreibacterium oceani]
MKPLYRTFTVCLLMLTILGLSACATTVPYQAMSDTKQILQSAAQYVKTPTDEIDFDAAKTSLSNAEAAMQQGDYPRAKTHLQKSKDKSQGIIKRYNTSNIQFRY